MSNSFVSKLVASGTTLADYAGDLTLFYGIKTGLNKAFIITNEERKRMITESSACKRVIKPLLVGDNIRKWNADAGGKWLIYLPHGADTEGLAPVLRHLRQFKDQLEARATAQRWYELQQPQARYAAGFSSPKIVFPDIAKESRFSLEGEGAISLIPPMQSEKTIYFSLPY